MTEVPLQPVPDIEPGEDAPDPKGKLAVVTELGLVLALISAIGAIVALVVTGHSDALPGTGLRELTIALGAGLLGSRIPH